MKKLKIPEYIDASKHPYASFAYGRGWIGHKTEQAARRAAHRDSAFVQRQYGGGIPQWAVCGSDGRLITGWQV